MSKNIFLLALAMVLNALSAFGQHVLDETRFNLQDVTLLEGRFREAQERNFKTLLDYDIKRILTPFIRQSGLSKTANESSPYYQWEYDHPNFPSWAWVNSTAFDGHIGGHYLSALSYAYAACHDPVLKGKYKERIDYMLQVLGDCQEAFAKQPGMEGFLGGIPNNEIWKTLIDGDYRIYNQYGNWIPYYCEQKILSGLRDAYVYTGSTKAKDEYRKLCDWIIKSVSLFTQDIMEMQILQWEAGSINEVLADANVLLGGGKYMDAAKKFSHQIVIENLLGDDDHKFLDLKHADEMSGKFVGNARIAQLKRDDRYLQASFNYWKDVVHNRTVCFGGSGVASYYQPADKTGRYITEADGPETCNSSDMMKITQYLFQVTHDPSMVDYYENVQLNHILGTLDPETGGYAFYTPSRPSSYRIYSTINESMWCCVGTGMELHSKYGEWIYSYDDDTLFVNLFIASELNNAEFGLRQESNYPYGSKSTIKITKPGHYKLAIRHPAWAGPKYEITVNGQPVKGLRDVKPRKAGFIYCGKTWNAGDVIEVNYPMMFSFDPCPNVSNYIALRMGPSVLAAVETGTKPGEERYELLSNEYGREGQHDHEPSVRGKFPSLALSPMLICDRGSIPSKIKFKDAAHLILNVDATAKGSLWHNVEVRPFYDIHHQRYTLYWNQQTESAWIRNPLYQEELRAAEMESNTYDQVRPGDEASERQHAMATSKINTHGNLNSETFRDAPSDQWFEYALSTDKIPAQETEVVLMLRFTVSDRGRAGVIFVDGTRLQEVDVPMTARPKGKNKFFDVTVSVPVAMLRDKPNVKVRFQSATNNYFPKTFSVRLMKNEPTTTD